MAEKPKKKVTPTDKFDSKKVRKFGNVKKASEGERTAQRAEGKTPKSPRLFKFKKDGSGH
jgi:hypothetical protein